MRSEAIRRRDRALQHIEEILDIVERARILHLAMMDGDYPYVVPMHYAYEYRDGELIFYLHSAKEGHKLELLRKNPHICFELSCDIGLISGGELPCRYGSSYASVIGRGDAETVQETEEKIAALKLLMRQQTGRDFLIDEKMAASVEVLRLRSRNFSGKARRASG